MTDGSPIKEVGRLSVLSFHFDCRLTWAAMIHKMVSRRGSVWDIFVGFWIILIIIPCSSLTKRVDDGIW